jgi:5-methylcytosine-specific restriction endonuclease McrA
VDIPAAVRQAVYERDNRQCVGCGVSISGGWYSIQHRMARGTGGTNALSNLVLLCGSATSPGCHRQCEDRLTTMRERGLWVPSWGNPVETPITAWDGRVIYLADDGSWSFTIREEQE